MGLSASTLGGLIKSEIETAVGEAQDQTQLAKMCNAIAKAVVNHIKDSAVVKSGAEVKVTLTSVPMTGTSPAGPFSGTVTGEADGTVTSTSTIE